MILKFQHKNFLSSLIILFISGFINAQPGGVPFSNNPFSSNPFGAAPKEKKKNSNNKDDKKTKDAIKDAAIKGGIDPAKVTEEKLDKIDLSDNNADENTITDVKNDETLGINPTINDSTLKIYGMDFFKNNSFSNSDKSVITPPPSYRVGSGDEIIVNIWGTSELQQKYIVGRDGSIFPGGIGKIYVQGLSYDNVRQIVSNKFRNNIAPGSNIDVQMGSIRTIKISIVGEVVKQGTVTISAFNTAFNALSLAGGITNLGNLRDIQIRRNNSTAYSIDLYEFIKTGGSIDNMYLEDGDIIFVGQYDKLVEASGSFKRPMLYQLKHEEALNNLIDLAGGPTADARASSVSIKSIAEENAQLVTINLRDLDKTGDTFSLQDGDVVTLNKILLGVSNTVEIKGAVKYNSSYQVTDGERLLKMITKAGGLTADAFTATAYITRIDNNLQSNLIKINLDNITENDYSKNIELLPGDVINIISKDIFANSYVIDIEGQVKKPGSMAYTEGMSLKDVIILAGGLQNDAEGSRIEIASIVDSFNTYNLSVKEKTVSKVYTINKNLEQEDITSKILVMPYDKIFVRKIPNFKLMEVVKISGGVKYPGTYPLLSKNEKISSVIVRAGGILPEANSADGRIRRKNLGRVVLNLEKAIAQPGGKFDMILNDADEIEIPLINDIVTVTGQVIFPVSMKFEADSADIKYYINAAGGFNERPWKDRINVQYANGQTKTTKRIFFIRKYPKVSPGSIVNVPSKPTRKDGEGVSIQEYSAIVTSLISTVTALVTIYGIFKTP
jgi:polysaccharide biosynthesis/export protein